MNQSTLKTLLLIAFVLVLIAVGGYFSTQKQAETITPLPSSQKDTADVTDKTPHPKTTNLALPERTNNAWEMKPFELPDTQGKKRTLSEWKGKVIMLNFWASWCAPCQFEIPRFVGYQKKYAEKGLQIVGIGLDDSTKLKNVERSLDMNYPTMVISQYDGAALLEKWGNDRQIVPYTVVIDKDGTIVYIHRGGMEDDAFNEYVLPLLK